MSAARVKIGPYLVGEGFDDWGEGAGKFRRLVLAVLRMSPGSFVVFLAGKRVIKKYKTRDIFAIAKLISQKWGLKVDLIGCLR